MVGAFRSRTVSVTPEMSHKNAHVIGNGFSVGTHGKGIEQDKRSAPGQKNLLHRRLDELGVEESLIKIERAVGLSIIDTPQAARLLLL